MENPHLHTAIKQARLIPPPYETFLVEQYADHGEDLLVLALLKAWVQTQKGKMSHLTYLEIGANHPIVGSSTFLFYQHHKMRGVLVEANPSLIKTLQKTRPDDVIIHTAVTNEDREEVTLIIPDGDPSATIVPGRLDILSDHEFAKNPRHVTVKACRINDILTKYFADASPAYLAIDIEGLDLEVLADIDFEKFRPLIIQIESGSYFIDYEEDCDAKAIAFMQQKNYHFIAKVSINLIFVSNEFFQTLPPPRTGQESITLSPPRYFTKKRKKPPYKRCVKTALNFIKSYFLFPWYVYKTYKQINSK